MYHNIIIVIKLLITRMITDQIGLHSVLLQLLSVLIQFFHAW